MSRDGFLKLAMFKVDNKEEGKSVSGRRGQLVQRPRSRRDIPGKQQVSSRELQLHLGMVGGDQHDKGPLAEIP